MAQAGCAARGAAGARAEATRGGGRKAAGSRARSEPRATGTAQTPSERAPHKRGAHVRRRVDAVPPCGPSLRSLERVQLGRVVHRQLAKRGRSEAEAEARQRAREAGVSARARRRSRVRRCCCFAAAGALLPVRQWVCRSFGSGFDGTLLGITPGKAQRSAAQARHAAHAGRQASAHRAAAGAAAHLRSPHRPFGNSSQWAVRER